MHGVSVCLRIPGGVCGVFLRVRKYSGTQPRLPPGPRRLRTAVPLLLLGLEELQIQVPSPLMCSELRLLMNGENTAAGLRLGLDGRHGDG